MLCTQHASHQRIQLRKHPRQPLLCPHRHQHTSSHVDFLCDVLTLGAVTGGAMLGSAQRKLVPLLCDAHVC